MGRKSIGKAGEELVSEKLLADGFTIRDRNWRCKMGEIDIVAEKDKTLHFIEVKALRVPNKDDLVPEDHFTKKKLARLKKLAQYYCAFHGLAGEIQIDLSTVSVGDQTTVLLYPNLS